MKERLLDLYLAPLRLLDAIYQRWMRFYDLPTYRDGMPASLDDRAAYHMSSLGLIGVLALIALAGLGSA